MTKPSAYKHALLIAVFVGGAIVIPAVSDTVVVAEDEKGSHRLDGPQVFPSLDVEVAFPDLPPLPEPVHLTHASDGSNRIFAASQPGRIYVFENTPDVSSAEVFLDIEERVNSGGGSSRACWDWHSLPITLRAGIFSSTTPG